jgi:S-formylglutathione hydrolase FrmB
MHLSHISLFSIVNLYKAFKQNDLLTKKGGNMKTLIKILMAVLTFGILLPSVTAQPYMRLDASFYSQALDEVRMVDIYLPADYYVNPEQQYAAIYCLHGATGNQNTHATEAMLYYNNHSLDTTIRSPAALYICPDGSSEPYLGSCYINSELYGNHEDYIIQDLIPFIESNFRVVPNKNFRFITGQSMGGFGSTRLSVKYPDIFRACMPNVGFLSISDVFLETWRSLCYEENDSSYKLHYNAGINTQLFFTMCGALSPDTTIEPYHVEFIFDTLGNWVDSVLDRWYEEDCSRKVKFLPDENELSWFLMCGLHDYMQTLSTYEIFTDSLDAYGIGYETYYFNGGHEWNGLAYTRGLHWMDSLINLSYQTMGIEIVAQSGGKLDIYPNPVATVSNIVYELDQPARVELTVLNQLGQSVINLSLGNQAAGKHLESIDVSGLPEGVYYCRLSVVDGRWSMCRKIVKL